MATYKLFDGVDIYYEIHGTGQPLVFLPGWVMTSAFFQKQISGLSDEFQVITIDQRGQGNSGGKDGPLPTIELMAKDLEEIIIGLKLQNIVLIGWSMGALVAWKYYELFGDKKLEGLIVLEMAANLGSPDWASQENASLRADPDKHINSFLQSMFVDSPNTSELLWMIADAKKTPVHIAEKLNLEIAYADARPILPKINIPTLIIYGKNLLFFTEEQEIDTRNGILDAKTLYFDNSKHCPFWEEPEQCNDEIRKFVRSLSKN